MVAVDCGGIDVDEVTAAFKCLPVLFRGEIVPWWEAVVYWWCIWVVAVGFEEDVCVGCFIINELRKYCYALLVCLPPTLLVFRPTVVDEGITTETLVMSFALLGAFLCEGSLPAPFFIL